MANQSVTEASWAAAEASVRQLIQNGKEKTALDRAKELHKKQHDGASESLLLDAYAARIHSLSRQNLHVEAKALLDLVRERYPGAAIRLATAADSAAAQAGELERLLSPLADPDLPPERRASIEQMVEVNAFDLAAIAACTALPAEHIVRQAAAALHDALVAVTSGPVDDTAIALPQISRRSPLAPWKLLVRAIAAFYRKEDDACRQYLDAINPAAAPARLIPILRQLLAGETKEPLPGAAGQLIRAVIGGHVALRRSFEQLDAAFHTAETRRTFDSIRTAVRECSTHAPDLLDRLRQHIYVRCAVRNINEKQVCEAIGARPKQDADYLRFCALMLEHTDDFGTIAAACRHWEAFRSAAVEEGWFPPKGVEVAALYLHMAALLRRIPVDVLGDFRRSAASPARKGRGEDCYYLQPETLYQRACALDPHTEAFAQWFDWAHVTSRQSAEQVAKSWHKILPADLEPVLYLMESAERNAAFPTALDYLDRAERIDSLHPEVRTARLRLLARTAVRQLQKKDRVFLEATLDEMAALPQAQQGDRPALIAALRYIAAAAAGNQQRADVHREEAERLLGRAGGSLLLAGIAAICKRVTLAKLRPLRDFSREERATLPVTLPRVYTLLRDICADWAIPSGWVTDAFRQFPQVRDRMDARQLQGLGQVALSVPNLPLVYSISAAGLDRGGASEAAFLLLRALSLQHEDEMRSAICTTAAATLARHAGNMDLVAEAFEFLRDGLDQNDLTLTLEQAHDVLRKEKAAPKFPRGRERGPDYSAYSEFAPCDCPACRAERGEPDEYSGDFDDDRFEDALPPLPPGMPPELARALLTEIAEAIARGETVDQFLDRAFGSPPGAGRKKGRGRK